MSKRQKRTITALRASPVVERAVFEPAYGQVGALVGKLRGQFFVDFHAVARRFAGLHHAVCVAVGMGKDFVGERCVGHVLLDAEVGHAHIEVQRRADAYRRNVGGTVAAGAHSIEIGEAGDAAQVGDSAGMGHRGANVVDPLTGDELLAVEDGIKDFADCKRNGGVPAG